MAPIKIFHKNLVCFISLGNLLLENITEVEWKKDLKCLVLKLISISLKYLYVQYMHMKEECLPPAVLLSPSLFSRSVCDARRSLAPSKRCCNSSAVISPEIVYIFITLLDETLLSVQHSHAEIVFSILKEKS